MRTSAYTRGVLPESEDSTPTRFASSSDVSAVSSSSGSGRNTSEMRKLTRSPIPTGPSGGMCDARVRGNSRAVDQVGKLFERGTHEVGNAATPDSRGCKESQSGESGGT